MQQKLTTPALCALIIGLFLLTFSQTIKAQSALDGFDPNADGRVYAVAAQPDGKILIAGDFTAVGGVARTGLARLNADGTLDTAFNALIARAGGVNLRHIELLTDGKMYIAGNFSTVAGQSRPYIARLNADGNLDATFTTALADGANSTIIDVEVQSNGKILILGAGPLHSITPNRALFRLNTDGSHDTTFAVNPVTAGGAAGGILDVAIQTNGKILIGGSFNSVNGTTRPNFARLNSDGTLDTTLTPSVSNAVYAVKIQADGKFLIGGLFDTVNAQNRNKIARLNVDGTLDTVFNQNSVFQNGIGVEIITIQPDGKVLTGGDFTNISGQPRSRIARFNADGTLDSFNPSSDQTVDALTVQADGKILVGGNFSTVNGQTRNRIARLYENGTLDATLNPDADNRVETFVAQPDGKILVGGVFSIVGGQGRNKFARLNADGTADSALTSPFSSGDVVYAIALQTDGKILVGGTLFSGTPTPAKRIVRLNTDGTLDMTFNQSLNAPVRSIMVLADGKILVGGDFVFCNTGTPALIGCQLLTRLNSDGSYDGTFTSPFQGSTLGNGFVQRIIRQPDGRILVGGKVETPSASRKGIVRLNADGTLDSSFQLAFPNSFSGYINDMEVQSDGKIVAGGAFDFAELELGRNLKRFNSDGTIDSSFDALIPINNPDVKTVALQADGKILVGGNFVSIGGQSRSNFARLNVGGTADSFNPNANLPVYAVGLLEDGKILLVGSFSNVGGQPRNRIARLTNDTTAAQTLSVTQTTVSLTLSGAGPQLSRVRFEYSTDGTNYTVLGEGVASRAASAKSDEGKLLLAPTATTFTLTGLSLPTAQNVFIRAIGFDASGSEVTESGKNAVLFAPSAASVSVSGRILTPNGNGLRNARVILTDQNGNTQTAISSSFGYYLFNEVEAGQTYFISVSSKRFVFTPQVVSVNDNIGDLDFTAQ